MRKKILMLKAFYKNNMIPAVILLFLIIIAELLFAGLAGTYRGCTRTDRLFDEMLHEKDAVFVSRFVLEGPDETFYNELGSMSAVDTIYGDIFAGAVTYNGKRIRIMLADAEIFSDYELLDSDEYFSDTGLDGGIPQGIVSGDFFDTNGDTQDIHFDYKDDGISIRLIGNIVSPSYIPDFSDATTAPTTYDIIKEDNNDTIIMKDCPEVRDYMEKRGFNIFRDGLSFFVLFNDCSDNEKQAVYDILDKQNLYYTDADKIRDNSKKITWDNLINMLPLPVYLALVSAVLTFCFSILFLHSKMDLMLTFYLCGCSKKKGYGIMAFLLSMNIIPALLIGFISLMADKRVLKLSYGIIDPKDVVLDHTVYIVLICYALLLLLLSVLAVFIIYRRKSCAFIRRQIEL